MARAAGLQKQRVTAGLGSSGKVVISVRVAVRVGAGPSVRMSTQADQTAHWDLGQHKNLVLLQDSRMH